jgi:hypothetical protein
MEKSDRVDFGRLLGFDTVCDELSGSVDFQNEVIGARLGAKVGPPEIQTPPKSVE